MYFLQDITWLYAILIPPVPPETISFQNVENAGNDHNFTSGSVTYNLTQQNGFSDNVNTSCVATGARPEANVTWMIGK